jgi:hypothetical protein
MSHWSSGLPVCFPSQGTQVQIPRGVLLWDRDSFVSIVSLHWWPRRDWSCGPRPELSLGPRADNVIIPLDPTQLFCPSFTLAAGPPSGFTSDESAAGGEPLVEPAISLLTHHTTGPVDYLFASRHKGPRFKSPGGYLSETGIHLLALSRYSMRFLYKEIWQKIYWFIYTQLFMCSGRVHDPTSQFSSRPLFVCKFRRQGGTEAF